MADSNSLVNNTICLDVGLTSKFEEGIVYGPFGSLYPGMLCIFYQIPPTGERVITHSLGRADPIPPIFMVENPYQGLNIEEPTLGGDRGMLRILRTGDKILTKVTGPGTGIGWGDRLISDGNGWLEKQAVATEHVIAYSDEDDPGTTFPRWTRIFIA